MMKTVLTATSIAIALSVGIATQVFADESQNSLKEQLEVMNSIMQTKMGQQVERKGKRVRVMRNELEYTYLKEQGVVYRVPFWKSRFEFVTLDGHVTIPPMPPMPPMPEIAGEVELTVEDVDVEIIEGTSDGGARIVQRVFEDDGQNIEVIIDGDEVMINGEAVEVDGARAIFVGQRENTRELAELARKLREQRRQLRDLNFALENNQGDGKAKLEQQIAEAEKSMAQTRSEIEAKRAELRELGKTMRAEAKERKAQRQQKRQQSIAEFEQVMATTLCDYGNTLKALPKDEHVTFVLEGAGEEGTDKVFIFRQRDISNCSGKNGASDLLSKATTYSF